MAVKTSLRTHIIAINPVVSDLIIFTNIFRFRIKKLSSTFAVNEELSLITKIS